MKKMFTYLAFIGMGLLLLASCSKNNPPQFTTVTDYDGNIYRIYKIGTQSWMVGNLATTHYADGTPMVNACKHPTLINDSTYAYYFWQNCDTSYLYDFGLYYSWAAIMRGAASSNASPSGVQGPCPNGFHVPSDAEWQTLITYLGGTAKAGGAMKGYQYWEAAEAGYEYSNASGFNALPAGYGQPYPVNTHLWSYRDFDAYIWSSTLVDSADVHAMFITSNSAGAVDSTMNSADLFSCRCLQNY